MCSLNGLDKLLAEAKVTAITYKERGVNGQTILDTQTQFNGVSGLLQVVRIGDLAVLATPNEVFAETGMELKQESPFRTTCTIFLAGGRSYLPPPRHHALGDQ